jgi:glycosyltransferase involved in cell wall biosynthesis
LAAWTRGAALGVILYEDTGRSQHFCSPNKLWEYAAAGVPTLASDLPEIARVVGGKNTGFLLPPAALPAKVAGVVNNLTDATLAEASASAIRFSREENWDTEVIGLIDMINDLSRRRPLSR